MLPRSLVVTQRIIFVLYFTLIKTVLSTGFGKCPMYEPPPDFDLQRMSGTWYEVERSFYIMEMTASCVELHVSVSERTHFFITINLVNRWTESKTTTYGIGIPTYKGSSQFRYKVNNRMPYVIGRMLPGAGNYYVLSTDYKQFAIIWSCTNYSIAHHDNIWVLGRTREIAASVRAIIYSLMQDLQLDPERLIISKNDNCRNLTASAQHIKQIH